MVLIRTEDAFSSIRLQTYFPNVCYIFDRILYIYLLKWYMKYDINDKKINSTNEFNVNQSLQISSIWHVALKSSKWFSIEWKNLLKFSKLNLKRWLELKYTSRMNSTNSNLNFSHIQSIQVVLRRYWVLGILTAALAVHKCVIYLNSSSNECSTVKVDYEMSARANS